MTRATCLIAEDEPLLAEALRADLAAVWPELEIVAVVGDGASALSQTLALRPQVCFLDIRMPAMTGLEVAQALAEDWPDGGSGDAAPFPLLVFATAYDAYALQAFEAQAVDYLVKPVDRARLKLCVDRLRDRLAERRPEGEALQQTLAQLRALLAGSALGAAGGPARGAEPGGPQVAARPLAVIQAQVGHVVHLVPVDEVVYFEAADKYVRVVTANAEHLIRMSLKELLPQLDPQRFWQVHRGTIVQARCIASARREDTGKVTLTLTQRAEKLVASRLYAHLFRGM